MSIEEMGALPLLIVPIGVLGLIMLEEVGLPWAFAKWRKWRKYG